MYAVIFKAITGQQDEKYIEAVAKMRDLAFNKYGCLDFIAVTEEEQEITISYWPEEKNIRQWKNDPEHLLAQSYGQEKWYQSYSVEVVKIERKYSFSN